MGDFRIGIGQIRHESNSFFREGTTPGQFSSFSGGVTIGRGLFEKSQRNDEIAGFLNVLGPAAVETVGVLRATTPPSGPVTEEAVGFLEGILRRQLHGAGKLDGICFALHGAMSGEKVPDLDGYFLEVIREHVGPYVPVVCSLDCHAVVTRQMLDLADALVAYRTHPHTDVAATGSRAARILLDMLRGKVNPVMRCRKIPMLFVDSGTAKQPLKALFDEFISRDGMDRVIACSLCPSYPYQDVPEQGWAALAVTDDDEGLAEHLARKLAQKAWDAREKLLPEPMLPLEEAVRKAVATPGCPVVIVDAADNVGAGCPGDTTVLLETLLRRRTEVDGLILAHIPDADALAALKGSKVGDTVSVEVGGKRDPRFGAPAPVSARILCLTEGSITDDGPFGDSPTIDVGAIACLAVDNVRLVLTERVIKGPQPSLFRKVGIEPFDAKIVMLKSGIGYKVTYAPVAKAVFLADCPGPGSHNIRNFDFKNVPQPMFPLDPDVEWQPCA